MSASTDPRELGLAANPPLSARPSYRETPDVVAGVRRLIGAVGKRIATEDPDDLLLLAELEREVQVAWATAVAGIRESGATDREIGRALGVTKQAVAQRWPRTDSASGGASPVPSAGSGARPAAGRVTGAEL